MELRVQQARAIVHEINTVLPQKINLMNKDGIIIASTDPERIHTFHGGAARVIRENLDELRIYRENEYPGTRPGTNFMLQVEGVPIGVLGITGSYESILPIANVIRKMTELLVHEQEYQRMQTHLQYQRHLFLQDSWSTARPFSRKSRLSARACSISTSACRAASSWQISTAPSHPNATTRCSRSSRWKRSASMQPAAPSPPIR